MHTGDIARRPRATPRNSAEWGARSRPCDMGALAAMVRGRVSARPCCGSGSARSTSCSKIATGPPAAPRRRAGLGCVSPTRRRRRSTAQNRARGPNPTAGAIGASARPRPHARARFKPRRPLGFFATHRRAYAARSVDLAKVTPVALRPALDHAAAVKHDPVHARFRSVNPLVQRLQRRGCGLAGSRRRRSRLLESSPAEW